MATLRDIFVRLGLKTDPGGFKRANRGIQDVKESALTLGRVLATGAVAVGFKQLIGVASDIEETANKFGAVFGAAGDSVTAQLDDIRARTGATALQLQDMSSNIGALIKPSLGSARAAGEMAASVSELALDISSFNNVTSEDALVALRSGLIGSAEPLQRFGVDTRAAALEQEALRLGITKSYKSMSEGERIQLRYAAIQRQLGSQGATGDATRTARGFANASRNLVAALKETAGVIGTFLLGTVGKLVNQFRTVTDAVQDWLKANRDLIQQRVDAFMERVGRVLRGVRAFAEDVWEAFDDWRSGLGPVGEQILKVTGVVLALVAALMLPGVPILFLIALIALLIEDFQTWREGGESVIGDLVEAFKMLGEAIAEWASGALAAISTAWDGIKASVLEAIDGMTAAIQGYIDAVVGTVTDLQRWVEEHRAGISVVTSLVTGAAVVWAAAWVRAHAQTIALAAEWYARKLLFMVRVRIAAVKNAALTAAAWVASSVRSIGGWLVFQAWVIRLWLHTAQQAVVNAARSSAAWVASAARSAAAWLVSTAPLVLTAALLTIIIGTLIFLGRELYRLATGQENFFTTMYDGIAGLIEEFGGVVPAIKEMLAEALRFWVEFFGGSMEEVNKFVTDATQSLTEWWDGLIDGWGEKARAFFSGLTDWIPDLGWGDDEKEAAQERLAERRRAREAGATESPEGARVAARTGGGPMAAASGLGGGQETLTGPLAGFSAISGAGVTAPASGLGGQTNVNNQLTETINVSVAAGPGMDERRLAELTAQEIRRARENETRLAAQSFALEAP